MYLKTHAIFRNKKKFFGIFTIFEDFTSITA